ncbi:hypothetical protein QAD02_004930 [Eretmocerus hayati]|uniref:Uncharacterized protein n=1 Tax=Eretmocerus hayati TaxID=131215 RepID=A0ACC2NS46_9HYME|nr:hypothetical protein QAD02_004930 [Eretmocerus hayati]
MDLNLVRFLLILIVGVSVNSAPTQTPAKQAPLLEVSQAVWSRLLSGNFYRLGKLDPLRVPVVRVDQSDNGTSYRVVLKDLEVIGLNKSRIESVKVVRGELKVNLTEGEAGYVNYDDQKAVDSIRYRFHTIVKEPKKEEKHGVEGHLEYDPVERRAQQEEDDTLRLSAQFARLNQPQQSQEQQKRRQYYVDLSVPNGKADKEIVFGEASQPQATTALPTHYDDMKVVFHSTPRNPSSVRVVYFHSYASNGSALSENSRPCIGACKSNFAGSTQTRRYTSQEPQYAPYQPYANYEANPSSTQQPNYGIKAHFGSSGFSAEASNPKGQNHFSIKSNSDVKSQPRPSNPDSDYYHSTAHYEQQPRPSGGTYEVKANSGNNREFSVKGGEGFGFSYSSQHKNEHEHQPQNAHFSVKGSGYPHEESGVKYSGGYGQFSAEGQRAPHQGEPGVKVHQGPSVDVHFGRPAEQSHGPYYREQPAPGYEAKGHYGGGEFEAGVKGVKQPGSGYHGSFKSGQLNFEGQSGNRDGQRFGLSYGPAAQGVKGSTQRPASPTGDYSEHHYEYTRQDSQAPRYAERRILTNAEEFEPYKSPVVRVESQPGYIDVVYASPVSTKGNQPRKLSPTEDPRAFVKHEGSHVEAHFSTGNHESQQRKGVNVTGSANNRRVEDLSRYAADFQEKQGYYEEGMELIYHFGTFNASRAVVKSGNDSLIRKKREHDREEEDVMHAIVRIRVPRLSVKAGYELEGKVDKEQLKGTGLFAGNFTDVTADFAIELKQVDNRTMIVRAARAKLVSTGREIKLEGMDEKGPVKAILSHGAMAAEAVAAMIADDLATKALNEGNSEAQVYKMYRNLPVEGRP